MSYVSYMVIHGDVYKMIKVCRHTWGCIQDDKGVSSYIQGDVYKMMKGVSS